MQKTPLQHIEYLERKLNDNEREQARLQLEADSLRRQICEWDDRMASATPSEILGGYAPE